MSSPASCSYSSLPPSQMSKHLVRSTIESFGSHLRVIAKTYTKRRGRAGDEELPTSPTGSGGSRVGSPSSLATHQEEETEVSMEEE